MPCVRGHLSLGTVIRDEYPFRLGCIVWARHARAFWLELRGVFPARTGSSIVSSMHMLTRTRSGTLTLLQDHYAVRSVADSLRAAEAFSTVLRACWINNPASRLAYVCSRAVPSAQCRFYVVTSHIPFFSDNWKMGSLPVGACVRN